MRTRRHVGLLVISLLTITLSSVVPAEPAPWRDPSPHRVRFVTVAPNEPP